MSDLVKALEGDEEAIYDAQEAHPAIESIAADEREHAEIWKRLDGDAQGGQRDEGRRRRQRCGRAS